MIEVNSTYMSLSKFERQAHLDLNTACLERGGDSRNHKGVLAQFLYTTIPNGRILLCHACHNGKCSNPFHLYWGTDKENVEDAKANGTRASIHARTLAKYGEEGLKEQQRINGAKGGRKAKIKKLIRLIFGNVRCE